jgi:hypothetical protein
MVLHMYNFFIVWRWLFYKCSLLNFTFLYEIVVTEDKQDPGEDCSAAVESLHHDSIKKVSIAGTSGPR